MEDCLEPSPPPSPESPKKCRRRSSFFEKRQSIVASPVESMVTETTQEQIRNKRLQDYTEALYREKVDWKNYYSKEKKQYDDCVRRLKSNQTEEVTVETLYGMLTAEDKAFLESGPDLGEVWRECTEACARAGDLMRLATRLCGRGERYQEHYSTLTMQDQHNTSHR